MLLLQLCRVVLVITTVMAIMLCGLAEARRKRNRRSTRKRTCGTVDADATFEKLDDLRKTEVNTQFMIRQISKSTQLINAAYDGSNTFECFYVRLPDGRISAMVDDWKQVKNVDYTFEKFEPDIVTITFLISPQLEYEIFAKAQNKTGIDEVDVQVYVKELVGNVNKELIESEPDNNKVQLKVHCVKKFYALPEFQLEGDAWHKFLDRQDMWRNSADMLVYLGSRRHTVTFGLVDKIRNFDVGALIQVGDENQACEPIAVDEWSEWLIPRINNCLWKTKIRARRCKKGAKMNGGMFCDDENSLFETAPSYKREKKELVKGPKRGGCENKEIFSEWNVWQKNGVQDGILSSERICLNPSQQNHRCSRDMTKEIPTTKFVPLRVGEPPSDP